MIQTNLLGRDVVCSVDPEYPSKSIEATIVGVFLTAGHKVSLLLELDTYSKGKLWVRAIDQVEMVEES